MKTFFIDTVIPGLTEYEDVLITREESKIYREIDKVLGQAMVETLELEEEVQGYEMVEVRERIRARREEDKHEHKAHVHTGHQAEDYQQIKPLAPESSGMSRADNAPQYAVTESGTYEEGA